MGKQVFQGKQGEVRWGTIRHDDQRPLLMAQAILRAHASATDVIRTDETN